LESRIAKKLQLLNKAEEIRETGKVIKTNDQDAPKKLIEIAELYAPQKSCVPHCATRVESEPTSREASLICDHLD